MRYLDSLCLFALLSALSAHAVEIADETRLDSVEKRGSQVMPFSLAQSTHIFTKTLQGGVQQVIAKDAGNSGQIQLIRDHLAKIAGEFARLDFSDPEKIHGREMPGLAELRGAQPGQLNVKYEELPKGGRIVYSTRQPDLVDAIHRWFDAQLSDHARHAISGHESHHRQHQ